MDEIEKVQEQMKADPEALKEKMATMVEAIMSIKEMVEVSAAYQTRARAKIMGEVEKVQEQMKADMEAMKEQMVGKDLGSTDDPMMCEFKTSMPSRHMACLPTIRHPMWRTLPMRMSITPFPYSLKANNLNLIMHMSLNPLGRHMKCPTTI